MLIRLREIDAVFRILPMPACYREKGHLAFAHLVEFHGCFCATASSAFFGSTVAFQRRFAFLICGAPLAAFGVLFGLLLDRQLPAASFCVHRRGHAGAVDPGISVAAASAGVTFE
jgi:hypothetical protein